MADRDTRTMREVVEAGDFDYSRHEYAEFVVNGALGRLPLPDERGVFLHSSKGTGKTAFVRRELVDAFWDAGVMTVLLDVATLRGRDPLEATLLALAAAEDDVKWKRRLPPPVVAGCPHALGLRQAAGQERLAAAIDEVMHRRRWPVALVVDDVDLLPRLRGGPEMLEAIASARRILNKDSREAPHAELRLSVVAIGTDPAMVEGIAMRVRGGDLNPHGIEGEPDTASLPLFPLDEGFAIEMAEHWSNKHHTHWSVIVDDPDAAWDAFQALGGDPALLRETFEHYHSDPIHPMITAEEEADPDLRERALRRLDGLRARGYPRPDFWEKVRDVGSRHGVDVGDRPEAAWRTPGW